MTKGKTIAPIPVEITEEKVAQDLNRQIDAKIRECSDNLARGYLELASLLNVMRSGKAYTFLGFEKWGDYLASKKEYGRTYLLYLYRLGQAGDLQRYVDQGVNPAKLIEYAKKVPPTKIPELIDATWELIKDKSVREASKELDAYVSANPGFQGKRRKNTTRTVRVGWKDRLKKEYKELQASEREAFIKELQSFLSEIESKK